MSTGHIKPELQRKQCSLYDSSFALRLAQRIIDAKLRNQLVVLRRYAKNDNIDIDENIKYIRLEIKDIFNTQSVSELNGREGIAAKYYFAGLSKCIDSDFSFQGRNRRPPKDPFNSMISLGYSIIMNEIYNEIESRGLSPYFGFMHRDSENHPTLVSDLLEEWRAVIIDAVVMSLINGHKISKDMFYYEDGGCFIDKKGLNIFINKLEKKLMTSAKYLYKADYEVTFRRAIGLQIDSLIQAIRHEDADIYYPIVIR